jgi:hypothetical protein
VNEKAGEFAAFFLTAFALVMPTSALADGACFRLVLKDWGNLKDNELVCLLDAPAALNSKGG